MIFITPGWKSWLDWLITTRFNGTILPIGCHCECQEVLHEHYIVQIKRGLDWNCKRTASKAYCVRHSKGWPAKFDVGNKNGNASWLMNKVLYILGTDSRNYQPSLGIIKVKYGAHTQQVHPFTDLPTMKEIKMIRESLREKSEEKKQDLLAWKQKMANGRAARRARASGTLQNNPRT